MNTALTLIFTFFWWLVKWLISNYDKRWWFTTSFSADLIIVCWWISGRYNYKAFGKLSVLIVAKLRALNNVRHHNKRWFITFWINRIVNLDILILWSITTSKFRFFLVNWHFISWWHRLKLVSTTLTLLFTLLFHLFFIFSLITLSTFLSHPIFMFSRFIFLLRSSTVVLSNLVVFCLAIVVHYDFDFFNCNIN